MTEVQLIPLDSSDREQFIRDNQEAFKYGALEECGQYNHNWHYSHLYPEESVSAAMRLGTALAMPIHWGAFVLSNHGWDDPPERFTREAEKRGLKITTPRLCETVCIDDLAQTERWWRKFR